MRHRHSHYRLVLLDLDGTLLNDAGEITPRVAEAIAAVRERGVGVGLASARPPRSLAGYQRQLGLETPLIAYNGALVYDPAREQALLHRSIPLGTARRVVEALRGYDPELNLSLECADRWYLDTLTEEIRATITRMALHPPHGVGCLAQVLAAETTVVSKIFFTAPPPAVRRLRQTLDEEARRATRLHSVADWHEILRARVSKGAALRWLARRLDLTPSQVLAIGDSAGDAPMLRAAGLGVAVASADPAALAAAEATVASNNHDGVAEALERFILGKPSGI